MGPEVVAFFTVQYWMLLHFLRTVEYSTVSYGILDLPK
jgi:hypothetical protein